jgi:localization factor PodJL
VAKLPASASGAAPAVPASITAPALIEAAGKADPMAQFEIGLRLLEGRGAQPDAPAALNWFAQGARNGFAPAQYSLGTLFEKGNGVTRDTGAARDWYLLAAKQGNIRAMHNLAVLYATGIEGKSDPETAASWFEKAAAYGMRDSQYNLGILYARGSGVEQSLVQSYKWFAIVAAAGDKDAESKQNEIGASLSADERKAADAAVVAWTPMERNERANTVEVPQEWTELKAEKTASVDMKRAVRNIQAILSKLGYDAGTPDGVLGGKTVSAISKFQKEAGLDATGKIDEPLIRALLARKNG